MATQEFDKLNNSVRQHFEDYFSVMQLPKEKHNRRVFLAMDFWDCWLFFTALLASMKEYSNANQVALQTELQSEILMRIGNDELLEDKYFQEVIQSGTQSIVNTTLQHDGVAYYTSNDRGMTVAEDMSNRIAEYEEYLDAIKSGKTLKTWQTMEDNEVRASHIVLDGLTIPIEDTFTVGGSLMRFPCDTYYGADEKEVINCRCWVEYK